MFDVTAIKSAMSLLDLAQQDTTLRRVASTAGGEWKGPCPKCGGRDRFRVQPMGGPDGLGWAACRKCWLKGGDVIGYVMWRNGCDFLTACAALGGPTHGATGAGRPRPPRRPTPAPTAPPGEAWQAAARQFVQGCARALWVTAGPLAEGAGQARAWLAARGLSEATLRRWSVGYNPRETWAERAAWGLPEAINPATGKPRRVWLPAGIVIPCEIGGRLWYLKFRRVPGEAFACLHCRKTVTAPGACPHCQNANPKYPAMHGAPALFLADSLAGYRAAVLTEGELDALLLWQLAGDLAGVATLASASKGLDLATWAAHLLPVSPLLLAFDGDAAGSMGADKLASLTARAKRARVPALRPGDKDLTDFHTAGGDLRAWLAFELARHGARPMVSVTPVSTPPPTPSECANVCAMVSPSAPPASTPSAAPIADPPDPEPLAIGPVLANLDDRSIHPAGPCWSCGAQTWQERPATVGGGYFCATCHPLPAQAEPAAHSAGTGATRKL